MTSIRQSFGHKMFFIIVEANLYPLDSLHLYNNPSVLITTKDIAFRNEEAEEGFIIPIINYNKTL